jgi:hypothetical protein
MGATFWFLQMHLDYLETGIPDADAELLPKADSGISAESKRMEQGMREGYRGSVDWKQLRSLMPEGNEPPQKLSLITPEKAEQFLAVRGETAVNLVTAYRWSKDRRLLDRAIALFPNEPLVILAAMEATPEGHARPGEELSPDPERQAWIERWKEVDPQNPVPWIYAAAYSFKSGSNPGALQELRAALERPAFYLYLSESIDAGRQLLEDQGIPPAAAGFLTLYEIPMTVASAAHKANRMLTETRKKAQETGDQITVQESLRLSYGLGRLFTAPEASRNLVGRLVGSAIEAGALNALPPGAALEWMPSNPAARLEEIRRGKDVVAEARQLFKALIEKQDAALLSGYVERLRFESESDALAWLKTQIR